MGRLNWLASASGNYPIGQVTITFQPNVMPKAGLVRYATTPDGLSNEQLAVACFSFYWAKCMYVLGGDPLYAVHTLGMVHRAATRLTEDGSTLYMPERKLDRSGACSGILHTGGGSQLFILTQFRVPLSVTNQYVSDSVPVLFSSVANIVAPDNRSHFAEACFALCEYWQNGSWGSVESLSEAGALGFGVYYQASAEARVPVVSAAPRSEQPIAPVTAPTKRPVSAPPASQPSDWAANF